MVFTQLIGRPKSLRKKKFVHAQYVWTTRVPDNANDWRKSFPPLASPCFVLCLIRVETEGLLDYQGRAGIIPLYGGTFAQSYSVSSSCSILIPYLSAQGFLLPTQTTLQTCAAQGPWISKGPGCKVRKRVGTSEDLVHPIVVCHPLWPLGRWIAEHVSGVLSELS